MELAIAVISLMWVIGILSLQRIDAIANEFTRALAYYLSLNQKGEIDQVQLSLKSLLPKMSIVRYIKLLVTLEKRWDKEYLKKSLRFFEIEERIKHGFETLLILTTVAIPLIYLIDFSSLHLPAFATKNATLYAIFFIVVLAALGAEKVLLYFSDKFYPIRIEEYTSK